VFRLLAHLIANRHRVVTRDELYDTIWNGRIVAESALYSRIKSARAAIGDEGQAQDQIRTVSRTGYQFVAEVAEAGSKNGHVAPPSGPGEAAGANQVSAPVAQSAHWSKWKYLAVGAAVSVLLVVAIGLVMRVETPAPATTAATVPTIAVLPFMDMSPNNDQEYFVDGLTEELTDHLSRLPGLRVVARTSTFAYKGRHEDLRTVARTLGVQNLLEGSVRRDGDLLRITAQLIDSTGKHIWSQTYDRRRADIFAIQEEVSNAIAAVLSVTVSATEMPAARGGTRNLDAYDAYVIARAALTDPSLVLGDKLDFGLTQLERATELDPDFAIAWAWQAITYHRSTFMPGHGKPELKARANRAAARAYALAPDNSWVLVAVALASMSDFKWADSENEFARARAAATGSENPWACSGCFMLNVGHSEDAINFLREAQKTDPLFASNPLSISLAYEMRGEFDLSDAELDAAAGLTGAEPALSYRRFFLAIARHDPAQIRARVPNLPDWDSANRRLCANIDHPREALAEIERMMKNIPPDAGPKWGIIPGTWAAYFGEPRLALELIGPVAFDTSATRLIWNPVFSDMRRLPEFKKLVTDLKLVDYWRKSGNWGDFCKPIGADDFECD
jgi:TolB-like protein/DNA-binding winged helix-turn-helix (wHTH) protein